MIPYDTILLFLTLVLLLYLSGRFSGAETAITSLSPVDIAEMSRKFPYRTRLLTDLRKDLDGTIIVILIGNNLMNVLISVISSVLAFTLWGNLGVTIAVAVITLLLLLFGEIAPKAFAVTNNRKIALRNAKALYWTKKAIKPVILALEAFADKMIRLAGGSTYESPFLVTDRQIKSLVDMGEKEGSVERIEKEIIHKALEFGDLKVSNVAIPKDEVSTISASASLHLARKKVSKERYTRFPVRGKDPENIIGIMYSKDLHLTKWGRVKDIMRPAIEFRSSSKLFRAFEKMKSRRIHMGIVVNGDGKFKGIITLEDILEKLVGEIYDEFD